MKIFIKIILLFLLISNFGISNASFTQDDLLNTYNSLKLIKSGDKYTKLIDLIMNKYGENEEILKKLQIRFEIVNNNLVGKNDIRSKNLKILLDYFTIRVYFALDKLNNQKELINNETIEEEIISEDIVETNNDLIFPGFKSSYNDEIKNILAGTEEFVYAGGVGALYEKAEVNSILFYINGDNIDDLKYSIENAYLYVEGLLLDIANYSDVDIINSTKASITFDNIKGFILPDDKQIDFRLAIKPNLIGYENIGKTMKDLIVSDVDFIDVIGLTSNQRITNINMTNFSSENFTISPAQVTIGVIKNLDTSTQIELNIKSNFGNNTIETSNSEPKINLNTLKFSVFGNDASTAIYELYNIDDSTDIVTGTYNSGLLEFDISTMKVQNKTIGSGSGENYRIRISGISTGISAELLRNGIIYDVNGISNSTGINANLINSIGLGYRDF